MEVPISSIVGSAFIQVNFSTSTKNPKDYLKSVGTFHHNPLIDRDIYKNIMASLPHATRITMLLPEFNRSDHYLCSSYFQPMDHADLSCEKIISKLGSVVGVNNYLFNLTIGGDESVHSHVRIVNRLCTSFRFGSLDENQFRCLVFILGLRSPCHAKIQLRLPFLSTAK
ncbi:unnamed protein product [Hymenolepis diminuta]|uniref:Uncharacterized protein n=1 Tax=Hymenolepis diminuta TaxID=6216 RepID=A0A564ZAR7_HYMDI|nr:unnamed protein product [Hymenolepis diminuta]